MSGVGAGELVGETEVAGGEGVGGVDEREEREVGELEFGEWVRGGGGGRE